MQPRAPVSPASPDERRRRLATPPPRRQAPLDHPHRPAIHGDTALNRPHRNTVALGDLPHRVQPPHLPHRNPTTGPTPGARRLTTPRNPLPLLTPTPASPTRDDPAQRDESPARLFVLSKDVEAQRVKGQSGKAVTGSSLGREHAVQCPHLGVGGRSRIAEKSKVACGRQPHVEVGIVKAAEDNVGRLRGPEVRQPVHRLPANSRHWVAGRSRECLESQRLLRKSGPQPRNRFVADSPVRV